MRALGLDGFSKGWVAVLLDGDQQTIAFHRDIADALSAPFDRAGIDIPIGMADDGERSCDLLARDKLRPHTSRVFTGARRWIWQDFSDPDEANRECERRGQKRVSRQLWHLGPKIMQVDTFVRAHRSLDVREVHPELVFLRLNANNPCRRRSPRKEIPFAGHCSSEAGFGISTDGSPKRGSAPGRSVTTSWTRVPWRLPRANL